MIIVRGVHNIKTHGSLDRAGLLRGAAKNMHGDASGRADSEDWNGSAAQHIYVRKAPARQNPTKLRAHCLRRALATLEELRVAVEEGFPVAEFELQRARQRVQDLQ